MVKLNENYQKLPGGYLFPEIAKRARAFAETNPPRPLIRMGIGDVTQPLAPAVVEAMEKAVQEMGRQETFRGYLDDPGYDFLREKIVAFDYKARGVDLRADEIFVSDGAKCDTGNIGDIFGLDNKVAVCDPVYPVYVDTNAMAGRAGDFGADGRWSKLIYMPCTEANGFVPDLPKETPDMIYLCYPNNPTGGTASREQLQMWVDYANKHGSVILFDSAYEAYISEPDIPHSIYEIDGAQTCAIEFRSYSKTAGFTGTRCAYTVVPRALERGGVSLNAMWSRRQATKFNGVPYIIQRGAEATYSPIGRQQISQTIAYYMENAKMIRASLGEAGLTCYGGVSAPFVWLKAPGGMGSWDFFDRLLTRACLVTTPGAGFGPSGEGFIRLTAFNTAANTAEAMERVKSVL
jgi:LL-diaminopimelate aminotransferase